MKFKFILISIFLLITVPQMVIGDCYLHRELIDNEWRLILKDENGNLQLCRDGNVKENTVLYMACNSNNVTEVSCKNGQLSPRLPLEQCAGHMVPQLKLENDRNLCDFNLYRVGYQIHCHNRNYFFETYKVCFDFNRKRAVFTINEAYPFVKPRPYGMQFDPDEIFTMNIFSAYNKRDIYAQFNNILGADQQYMPSNAGDERIDRGHLTPVADYMTNTLIATTFKMVNVIPQFHSINEGNWKNMEEWARNPVNTPSKVCSGAFDWVLKLADTNGNLREMYLRQNLIPIPLWTYKIVLNSKGMRTVFLQYNNIHDGQVPPPIPGGLCQETSCPSNIQLVRSNYRGYTYCCNPDHFMRNSVPFLRGYC